MGPDPVEALIRYARIKDMACDFVCACCGGDGVTMDLIDGPVAEWRTWSCGRCGYQLREHVRKSR